MLFVVCKALASAPPISSSRTVFPFQVTKSDLLPSFEIAPRNTPSSSDAMRLRWPLALLLAISFFQVIWNPFTKVEESFNLQAIHDILHYGLSPSSLDKYDHVVFTGPVPRTFVGALGAAALAKPVIVAGKALGVVESKFHEQIIGWRPLLSLLDWTLMPIAVRLVLATVNVAAIASFFFTCAGKVFGRRIASLGLFLTAVQFHLPFYAGRTLPNILAFPFSVSCSSCVQVSDLIRLSQLKSLWASSFYLSIRRPVAPMTIVATEPSRQERLSSLPR